MVLKPKVRKLYVLATPIGNLDDISGRALAALRTCDIVAAEDTRVARSLLAGLGLKGKKTLSVREHNERRAAAKLASLDLDCICYLSDAGTPAISDPGALLVASLRQLGFCIVPLPGPSAVAAALSVAGIAGGGHVFIGFLPLPAAKAEERLLAAAAIAEPIVFFASRRQIKSAIRLVAKVLGSEVELCLCRELTKVYEQIVVAKAAAVLALIESAEVPERGEFAVVVKPAPQPLAGSSALRVARLLGKEMPIARAAKLAARICGADGRLLYQALSRSE